VVPTVGIPYDAIMTTLHELGETLPNGFQDSYAQSWSIDFVARNVVILLEIWIGKLESEDYVERERYRPARLTINGLHYCFFDPPAATYPFAKPEKLWIDLCAADAASSLSNNLPTGVFAARFYVSNWNSFIHVAAVDVSLIWLDAPAANRSQ
jgi:hypothetical protein